jgi:membrane-associated protease RseP (regulator of RpoE activity)
MTHQGEGVRVGSVQPGSGAENAGLKPGDRLLVLGGVKTSNLRALADALKDLQPGQTVDVEFARDAAILSSTLVLGERWDQFKDAAWVRACPHLTESLSSDVPSGSPTTHAETDCMAGVVGLEVRRETGKE